jgi:hypothetical protein
MVSNSRRTPALRRDLLAAALLLALASPLAAQNADRPPSGVAAGGDLSTPACTDARCTDADGRTVLVIRARGESESRPDGDDAARQPDRRVDIEADFPGRVEARGRFVIDLPQGGSLWATEDPQLVPPEMSASALSVAAFEGGRIVEPVTFRVYTNYAAFIESMEVVVFRGADSDRVNPIATIPLPVSAIATATWDGRFESRTPVRAGDDLQYIVRATGKQGGVDETVPALIQLVRPEDAERARRDTRDALSRGNAGVDGAALEDRALTEQVFGNNALAQQNIPIYGSRVRIVGQDLPATGFNVKINGDAYPVLPDGRLSAEFLLPVGQHAFAIEAGQGAAAVQRELKVDVTGRYLFLVGLADFTLSGNDVSGSLVPVGTDDRYDDTLTEGRLAFYLKGKVQGKYLVTAQADTREQEIRDLFDGFLDPDPQDIFRRLDPEAYYPVYGDDSTTYRDVDTQGRLYVRVDWDKNQALWGNFGTGIVNGEYAQYQRSLYGGALSWRSRASTALGEPRSTFLAFASEQQTAPGHTELLGTGGSLYYLRHTDLLPGSDVVVLEVRDRTTGRVEARRTLVRDIDYDIDSLQGRILLTRPLAQVVRENLPTLTRDAPLDGFENRLIADYEFVSVGFDDGNVAAGVSGRHWFNEHLAVGALLVDEQRAGDDYALAGGDITLQAGRGTYLRVEQTRSESTGAPVFFSDNGGLSFTQLNPIAGTARAGDARAVEARANLEALGWTKREWAVGAWWRDVDAGFSVARADLGLRVRETGAEATGQITEALRFSSRWSNATRGDDAIEQVNALLEWRLREADSLAAELREVRETRAGVDANGTLLALRYARRFNEKLEGSVTGQFTLDDDSGAYADNDAITLGARYLFGDFSALNAEVSTGDRGDSATLGGEYRIGVDRTLYAGYTWASADADDPLFGGRDPSGLTVGQRWRLNSRWNLFNESQFLKERTGSGLSHSVGLDFYPGEGWTYGVLLQSARLDNDVGTTDRDAISVSAGRSNRDTSWSSKLEWRRDSGAENRRQWVTTNQLLHRLNEDWRIAARINHSDTDDRSNPQADARFTEANLGFAYRPFANDRVNVLGRYTYLYDLSSLGQETFSEFDQRSQILSFEGILRITPRWEAAAKVAQRKGEARSSRNAGPWFDTTATLLAGQIRYETVYGWDALAEYRWLNVDEGDSTRQGWLLGVDRHLGERFRIGVGYNFTDFSDDLTRVDFDHKGWFLNVSGNY